MFPETYITRQVTLSDFLFSWLGDGDKWIEVVYCEEKIYCTGPIIEQPGQDKKLSYGHEEPNKPTHS
jgi:hypothetical protein